MKKTYIFFTKLVILFLIIIFIFRITSFSYLIEYNLRQKIYFYSAFLIFIPVLINLFLCSFNEIKYLIKTNIFVFLYLLYSLYFIIKDPDQLGRMVFFYELFFLSIGFLLCKMFDNLDLILKTFIYIVFTMNILTVIVFKIMEMKSHLIFVKYIQHFIIKYTFFNQSQYCTIYVNPNYAGIVTGICIFICINYFKKRSILKYLFLVFSVWFIWFQQCRSAQLALIFCAGGYVIEKCVRFIKPKQIASGFLIISLFFSMVLVIFVFQNSNSKSEITTMTAKENEINVFSSQRYLIWKMDLNGNKRELLFGTGNFEREKEARNNYIRKMFPTEKAKQLVESFWSFNTHNGYIGTLIVKGFVGLILFILILLRRIHNMSDEEAKKWYLCLSFFFLVNIFESYFITEIFLGCFIMMLLMGIGSVKNQQLMYHKK
ncbi:O-antigen ligase family protein [Anaerostipes sp.]|uniref:O-antigen ligase family protein n=1 Tax=Anaerostipes sp. TaxID=1872530 RepID=UPI0025BF2407|nr:O-antigen ligase family protein [Anaerostipes sp.]MBS7007129.1 O-antigen ligase family protein [Anaerostipes sp.]